MDLFQRLAGEHRRIESVTRAVDAFADAIERGAEPDVHELFRFVTFFAAYSSGYHHEFEETVLFPTLALCGFALDSGPLGDLHDQHREQARLLCSLEMTAATRRPWSAATERAIAAAAHELASFERAHMTMELHLLFPVAQNELLLEHAAELERAVRRFEARRAVRWNVEWLERLGEELSSHASAGQDATAAV